MADYSTEGKLRLFPFDVRFRPIAPPVAGIFDDPQISVCLNVEWAGHLDGVLERLLWRDAWDGDQATQEWAVGEVTKLVAALMQRDECMNCCDDLIDRLDALIAAQNNTALYDKIEDWQNQLADLLEAFQNGGLEEIAPNTVYDESEADADRDKALCFVISLYISQVCDLLVASKRNATSDLDSLLSNVSNMMASGGVVAGLAVTASLAVSPWLVLGFALSAAALQVAALVNQADVAIFEDEGLRDDIVCCMYLEMKGSTPNQVGFSSSLSACSFEDETEQLRAIIHEFNQSNDAFLQFTALWSESFDKADVLPDCACEVPENVTPIINTDDWIVPGGAGGTITNMGGGFWKVATGAGNGLTIKEATGLPFTISDITYVGITPQCNWYEYEAGNVQVFDSCTGSPAYTGAPLLNFGKTFIIYTEMTFKMNEA